MSTNPEQIPTEQEMQYQLQLLQTFAGLTVEESRSLADILTADTPKEWIHKRVIRGGGSANYIPGWRFIERFNQAFGFLWSFEVPKVNREGNEVVVQGRWSLQIPGRTVTREHADGTRETIKFESFSITKEQFGSAQIKRWAQDNQKTGVKRGDVMDLGNDYKAAATDAMKKCGTQLGIFLDVYGARDDSDSEEPGPTNNQLAAFYLRAEKCQMDKSTAEKWAEDQLSKPIKDATAKEILGLVADLIDLANKLKAEQR